ncbi:hypothetical protein [Clostridium lacusfryxellense]|uniref:hypothetical protein n=1 Tax=Clostridium lacusfryxellense TaxID=205328 RepID=UPI001C0E3B13|nr:hypothetical protein [Clostridium lacusfryxellense]MBU3111644.1 hypothetical protein [Clostridium lacusfryxellense]
MIEKSIKKLDIFKWTDKDSQKTIYGYDQEWYCTHWQRQSGCGPTAASSIMYYLNHTRSIAVAGLNISKENCLSLMEEVWEYVTPTERGIPTTEMFYEAVLVYAKSKGINLEYNFCDLPEEIALRPKLLEVLDFLDMALTNDAPVAFLNLSNGEEKNLESWHWVIIVSIEYSEDGRSVFINILDAGMVKKIDLLLWYNTTTLGGGFVYFTTLPK